jgi:hypothetical protein
MAFRRQYRRIGVIAMVLLCSMTLDDRLAPRGYPQGPGTVRGAAQKKSPVAAGINPEPGNAIRLAVRVVDTSGKPVPNATVHVIVLTDEKNFQTETVAFDGTMEFAVGADGRLLTPRLELDKAYVLQVDAAGMLSGLSRWSRSFEKGIVTVPDVVLRRLLPIAGTVVGRDNQPIAGVIVTQSGDGPQRTQATTDRNGRFEIAGVPEGSAFLFAEKEGYAFCGQSVLAETGPVDMVLEKSDDPRRRRLASLPPPPLGLTREERFDLAFQVLKPRLDHRLAQKPPRADFWLMRELARANLPAALNYFDALVAAGISQSDRDRQIEEIADALVLDDPAEAMALVQHIPDPAERSSALSSLSIQLTFYAPRATAAHARYADHLAAETVFAARSAADPSLRVSTLVFIAAKLARRGRSADANILLDAAQEALPGLDPEIHKWHFAQTARTRALIDPDEAGKQIAAIPKDAGFWRLFTLMQIARTRPHLTEQLLAALDPAAQFREERVERPQRPPLYCTSCDELPQIGIQMAATDPDCAERITNRLFALLETVATPVAGDDPVEAGPAGAESRDLISDVEVRLLKSVTLARMAERAVATDRLHARRWLEEAVRGLAGLRHSKYRDGWFHASAAVLATLVPLAEQIDPALAHELFWRSLALRVPRSAGDGRLQRARESSLATLARMLARYDLDVARQLLAPLVENNRGEFLAWSPGNDVQIRVDCDALRARARTFIETPFDESRTSHERLRLELAGRLADVQNQIERDGPDYLSFELELIREQLGLSFHHPRMDE